MSPHPRPVDRDAKKPAPAGGPTGIPVQPPRPLTRREREIVDLLLSVDFPDRGALRRELPRACVYQRCVCGCPTIDVTTDDETGIGAYWPEVEAESGAGHPSRTLILFVGETGFSIELVPHEEDPPPHEFPPRDTFEQPRAFMTQA